MKIEPNNPEFLSTLGTLLAMDKKLDESTAVFRKAVHLAPADFTSRRYLAANLWQLHSYGEAKHELETILLANVFGQGSGIHTKGRQP